MKCDICHNDNEAVEMAQQRCHHSVCWLCLNEYVHENFAFKIKCPVTDCSKFISDGNIRKTLSTDDIVIYDALQLQQIQIKEKCLLPDCPYIYICNEGNMSFNCPRCSLFNCISCKAAHRYLTCTQYKTIDEAKEICENEIKRAKLKSKSNEIQINRDMLKAMDDDDIFFHDDLLECSTCNRSLTKGDLVVLRCLHIYCRFCLNIHINMSNIPIACPSDECKKLILEREIKSLISKEELKKYIDKCNSCAKGKLDFTFQCQTGDCLYFVTYSTKPDEVHCPLCKVVNCTKCFAIHTNETCEQFKERIKSTPYGKDLLDIEEKIRSKEWMRCLKCHQLLKKTSGCSWIQCVSCNFEMCWALQMRRWGPKGRGDESDGCKCQILGQRCTSDCGSCEPHYDNPEENPLLGDLLFMFFLRNMLQDLQPPSN